MDYPELKRDNERLRSEKRTLISDREEKAELVEYVERQRTLEERERERWDAPIWTRAKWYVFGRNRDGATARD